MARLIDADALLKELPVHPEGGMRSLKNESLMIRVRETVKNAPTIGGWTSVKDGLPENQNPVMVFVPPHVDEIKGTFLGYVGMAYYTSLGEGFWCGTDGNLYGAIGMIHTPTHWMPLPEPPTEEPQCQPPTP